MSEHYKQLPENYDDTIYEGFDHYDDSGWSEKKWTNEDISWVPAKKWDEKEVPKFTLDEGYHVVEPVRRRKKQGFFSWLWRNLPDVLVFIIFMVEVVGFVLAYFRNSIVDMIWYGVIVLLFAAGYSRRK